MRLKIILELNPGFLNHQLLRILVDINPIIVAFQAMEMISEFIVDTNYLSNGVSFHYLGL